MAYGFSQISFGGILGIVELLLVLLAIIVVPRNRPPSSSWAWILLILLLPIVGALVFLVIGIPQLPRKRQEKQRSMTKRIRERAKAIGPLSRDRRTPAWFPSVTTLNENLGAMPVLEGNTAHLLPHFDEQLAALIEAVRGSKRYVHVEFYILSLDDSTRPFFDALEDAVQRGVDVLLLWDHLGSVAYPGYHRTRKKLDQIGVRWQLMLPVQPWRGRYQRPDLRNHRKLLVVDGEVAITGSMNLIEPGYQKRSNHRKGLEWRDLMVTAYGPIVHEIDALFVTDWYSETDELLQTSLEESSEEARHGDLLAQMAPSGPGFEVANNLMLFNALIYYAKDRLSITSPYFVPDGSLLNAMTTAARRGVAVELFVGEISDKSTVAHAQHSYYEALLRAGVRIYLYPAPTILHGKHMSIDDEVTAVGSSNMDIRSFQLDLELTLMTCGKPFTDEMRAVEDEYRGKSRELTLQEWQRRSRWHRFIDNLAKLTSALQ